MDGVRRRAGAGTRRQEKRGNVNRKKGLTGREPGFLSKELTELVEKVNQTRRRKELILAEQKRS